MNGSREIINTIIGYLKKDNGELGMTTAEINGNYFSAVDVVMQKDGNYDVYRIAVVKQATITV